MSESEPQLRITDVSKAFGGLQALSNASFGVEAGSITSLIGPNGAGKTTMFNVVTGFHAGDAGTVHFEGRRIDQKAPHRIARLGLTRTFQTPRIIRRLTVLENLMLAHPSQVGDHLWSVLTRPGATRRNDREVRDQADELLRFINLDHLRDDFAGTLSGGQRKLLEFGRALMADPRLVLLDEPMAGVNRTLGRELIGRIHDLRDERGLTFLIIEHDMEMVMSISDTVVVMNYGGVIATGSAAEVRANPDVIDAYLGTSAEHDTDAATRSA